MKLPTGPRAKRKPDDAADRAIEVEVECLATAFRALRGNEGGPKGKGKRNRRGRKGK